MVPQVKMDGVDDAMLRSAETDSHLSTCVASLLALASVQQHQHTRDTVGSPPVLASSQRVSHSRQRWGASTGGGHPAHVAASHPEASLAGDTRHPAVCSNHCPNRCVRRVHVAGKAAGWDHAVGLWLRPSIDIHAGALLACQYTSGAMQWV